MDLPNSLLDTLASYLDGQTPRDAVTVEVENSEVELDELLGRAAYLRLKHGDPIEARHLLQSLRPCTVCSSLPGNFGHPDPDRSNYLYDELDNAVTAGTLEHIVGPRLPSDVYRDPKRLQLPLFLRCKACGTIRSVQPPGDRYGAGGYIVG